MPSGSYEWDSGYQLYGNAGATTPITVTGGPLSALPNAGTVSTSPKWYEVAAGVINNVVSVFSNKSDKAINVVQTESAAVQNKLSTLQVVLIVGIVVVAGVGVLHFAKKG